MLLLGLPLALLGASLDPNEYEAALGIDALDCDGPPTVYLFAFPALVLYGAGLVINGLRWRTRANLVVATICLAVCAALCANVARAVAEDREQTAACASR